MLDGCVEVPLRRPQDMPQSRDQRFAAKLDVSDKLSTNDNHTKHPTMMTNNGRDRSDMASPEFQFQGGSMPGHLIPKDGIKSPEMLTCPVTAVGKQKDVNSSQHLAVNASMATAPTIGAMGVSLSQEDMKGYMSREHIVSSQPQYTQS